MSLPGFGRDAPTKEHHGWSVSGIAPGARRLRSMVRQEPYEVRQAAKDCAELARAAGWRKLKVEPTIKNL